MEAGRRVKWEKGEQWALLNYVLSFANCLPFAKTVRPRFVALAMAMAAIKANLINFSLSLPFSLAFLLLSLRATLLRSFVCCGRWQSFDSINYEITLNLKFLAAF